MSLKKLCLEKRENLDMDGMWHDEIWYGKSVLYSEKETQQCVLTSVLKYLTIFMHSKYLEEYKYKYTHVYTYIPGDNSGTLWKAGIWYIYYFCLYLLSFYNVYVLL